MNETIEIILRSLSAFAFIVIIVHLLGKQTISQMTYNDFIASITLGSITGNLTFNTTEKVGNIILALIVVSLVIFLTTYVSLKNKKARSLFNGDPTVIIQDGKILEENLKKLKMTLDSMNQALRGKDIFDISEVEYAVVEVSGQFSVLKKQPYRNTIKKDLGIFTSNKSAFPVEIVMDGQLIEKNLTENQMTKSWFDVELMQRNLTLPEVSYCVRGTNGQLYFDLYHDNIPKPIDFE